MPVWVRIVLSPEDRATLTMWANAGRTEQRLARRAKVILLSDEKVSLAEIAERTGLTRKICSKWRKRFAEMGIAGLSDMPGRGRPKVYDAESRVGVFPPTSRPTWPHGWQKQNVSICILPRRTPHG